jgi:two-component system, OmpR family, response regulator
MTNAKLTPTDVKKILLIEDEGEMCLLLNLLLDSKEMTVDHVNTLTKAKEFLQSQQPSLILLDNRLPDGFGIDFIAFLKRHYPDIKIIMISGVDLAVRDIALENGADHFLPKPFTKTQLHESIRHLLN